MGDLLRYWLTAAALAGAYAIAFEEYRDQLWTYGGARAFEPYNLAVQVAGSLLSAMHLFACGPLAEPEDRGNRWLWWARTFRLSLFAGCLISLVSAIDWHITIAANDRNTVTPLVAFVFLAISLFVCQEASGLRRHRDPQ